MHSMGIIRQSISMALQNIRSNKMRSFLTMLGIVIGTASVIGLITLVSSATDSVMSQFSGLGAGTLTVMAPGTALKGGLSERDLNTLKNIEGVDGVSPDTSLTSTAVFEGEIFDKVSVEGKDTVYFLHNDIVNSGRALNESDMDGSVNVCIVDKKFVSKVLGGRDALGSTFKLNGNSYRIVGIRKAETSVTNMMSDSTNSDGSVLVPYKNALHMNGGELTTNLEVYIADGYDKDTVEKNLRTALGNIFNNAKNSYSIYNLESIVSMMNTVKSMMTTMLAAVASIALIVGGIGIMNMMLVSVSERTREIGLRKAMGAEPARIQMQFLLESITLSLMGGVIGIFLGALIAFVGTRLLGTDFTVSIGSIGLGVGFSAAVGIIFGWAPAKRASELNPIDALRSE